MRLLITAGMLLLFTSLSAQNYNLRITTIDATSREALGFVNVQVAGTTTAGTTDEQGRITLQVPAGNTTLLATYVGYQSLRTEVLVSSQPPKIVLALEPTSQQLTTVTVTSDDAHDRLERPLMGVERLSIRQLEVLPAALGEVDVLRGLQLLSGVNSAGEASNGLSIRGGTIDQNLVLFDGAPIFTPTHLFGLFSVFTPDAVGGVDLYRANIPARFGGRVSSVLDVQSRNPTSDNFKMQGGVGIVSSRLSVETPLTKDKKLKLLASGRAGLNDFVFNLVERLKNTESRAI
jgi:hypothetical protein